MRLLTILLFITLINCGIAPKTNNLIGEWIGVSTWNGSGLILDFKTENELIIGAIGTDSTAELRYAYNKSNGKLTINVRGKKKAFGKIEKVTLDRLTILTSDSNRLEFIKIKNVKLGVRKSELLKQLKDGPWTLKQESGNIRMDFLTTHRWDDNRQPFEAMFHYYWLSTPDKEKEIWNVGAYNGKLFMFFTNHQTEQITRQVLEVNYDKIVLDSYTPENKIQFQVLQRTKDKTQNTIDKLTAKRWTSIHLDTTFCPEWDKST